MIPPVTLARLAPPPPDTVTYTAPCPCGQPAEWVAVRNPSAVNGCDQPPGVEVRCGRCD